MLRKLLSIGLLWMYCSTVYAQIIDTVCIGTPQMVYSVDSVQGSIYRWTVDGGSIVSGNGSPTITVNWGKTPGQFKLSVTEQNAMGCWGDTQHAYVWVQGTQFKTRFPNYACVNDSVTIEASGGSSYLWSNGQTDPVIQFQLTQDTFMQVTISDTSCGFASEQFDIPIKAASKPVMSIVTEANSVFKNQPVTLFYSGQQTDRISWQIDKPHTREPAGKDLHVRFRDTGDAVIKVIAVNQLGCTDSTSTTLEVKEEQLFFPNSFTPNRDGLNDVFKPGGMGVVEYQLFIYNRWGQTVFQTNDFATGWDGTFNSIPVPDDVYIYQCEVVGPSGQRSNYSGNITVIR